MCRGRKTRVRVSTFIATLNVVVDLRRFILRDSPRVLFLGPFTAIRETYADESQLNYRRQLP